MRVKLTCGNWWKVEDAVVVFCLEAGRSWMLTFDFSKGVHGDFARSDDTVKRGGGDNDTPEHDKTLWLTDSYGAHSVSH